MQSHEGLFDKLKLGPKYTRHSRVGTWTLNQITVRDFKGKVGLDSAVDNWATTAGSAVDEDKGDVQKDYQGKKDSQDIGGLVIIKSRPFLPLTRH